MPLPILDALALASIAVIHPVDVHPDSVPAPTNARYAQERVVVSASISPLTRSNVGNALATRFQEAGYLSAGAPESAVLRGSIRYELTRPISLEASGAWGFQQTTASFEGTTSRGAPIYRDISTSDFGGSVVASFDFFPFRIGAGRAFMGRDWTTYAGSCRCTVVNEGSYHLPGWISVAVLHLPWKDAVFGEVRAQAGRFERKPVGTGYHHPAGTYEAGGMLFSIEAGGGIRVGQDRRAVARRQQAGTAP